jgi:hypothetical protein
VPRTAGASWVLGTGAAAVAVAAGDGVSPWVDGRRWGRFLWVARFLPRCFFAWCVPPCAARP